MSENTLSKRASSRFTGKKSIVILTIMILISSIAYLTPLSYSTPPVKKIRIGVIAPWSGTLEEPYGYKEWDTDFFKQIIEPDINAYLAKLPKDRFSPRTQVEFLIESAGPEGDSAAHLEMVKKFHKMGVNLIIGGYYTYLAADSLDYINKHDMVMISPSATGAALAIPDNLFRLVPDDTGQGKAISAMLEHESISRLVIIQQLGDPWADGIVASIGSYYSGVKVFVTYGDTPVYSDVADAAEAALTGAVGEGVLCLSYGAEKILHAAEGHTKLLGVEWFGADATALSSLIIEDTIALQNAVKVKLFSSMTWLTPETESSSKFKAMQTRFEGIFPNEKLNLYTASEIDAAWLLTLAVLETQNNPIQAMSGKEIAKVLPDVASRYYGFGGWCELNAAGDRMPGNYKIWGYGPEGYHLFGSYDTASETLTWIV